MATRAEWDELRVRLGLEGVPDALLRQALSHPSWQDAQGLPPYESNQRLEFLGDAVLGLVVGEWFYHAWPDATEGDLTRAKSQAVRRQTLAALAARLELGKFMLLGPQEQASGGERKPSILADCVEALLGALYLARGLEAARQFILRHLGPELEKLAQGRSPLDPKSALQQLTQAKLQQLPEYVTIAEEGPPHRRIFEVEVRLLGHRLGVGRGTSKQRAQEAAARQALETQQTWLPLVVPQPQRSS
jgi:ribonuclease-3